MVPFLAPGFESKKGKRNLISIYIHSHILYVQVYIKYIYTSNNNNVSKFEGTLDL